MIPWALTVSPAAAAADRAQEALFWVFALLAAASALAMVASRNIVRTAVCLLFALLGVAGLYFLLNAEFLAAVQLVVYAGGTLILIIFGVMLTSKSPFSRFEPRRIEVALATVVAGLMFGALTLAFNATTFPAPPPEDPAARYPITAMGQWLLGPYLAPFELASVLLLVVMIGAAYLAKGRRRDEGTAGRGNAALSEKAKLWS